ncbi:MAG: hypothetical protein U5O69_01330 [Candidatus Competibacteraceae bacterium]|nr:hypothetical protein [Candidatus Competibacteraceae bacterium]
MIKARDQYYAVDRAVWYQSDQPDGGYQVATSVPQEIYQIPPSSPVYNARARGAERTQNFQRASGGGYGRSGGGGFSRGGGGGGRRR